eukprot:3001742-Pyramimonas_sp.AAC.1
MYELFVFRLWDCRFTAADYARMEAEKKRHKERLESSQMLKTAKMRELEREQRARQIGITITPVINPKP